MGEEGVEVSREGFEGGAVEEWQPTQFCLAKIQSIDRMFTFLS